VYGIENYIMPLIVRYMYISIREILYGPFYGENPISGVFWGAFSKVKTKT
jgi:hypothetical protein